MYAGGVTTGVSGVESTNRAAPPAARTTRVDGRATIQLLLQHGHEELERSGAIDFNLDRVLRESDVSRSSLYHHFASREGFIAALEFENSVNRNMREMEQMRAFILGSTDHEQVLKAIELALSADGGDVGRSRRQRRVQSLAAAAHSKPLREMQKQAQISGSKHFAETLRMAAERGIIETQLPIDGIAYLIQSILVGRILADITDDESIDREWSAAASAAIRLMFTQG